MTLHDDNKGLQHYIEDVASTGMVTQSVAQ